MVWGECMKLREKEQSLGKSPELRADTSSWSVNQEGQSALDPAPISCCP